MQHSKLVAVQSYGSRAEADLAKGVLEAAGIQAMIQADTAGGMREHLAWSGAGFQILVREEETIGARDALAPPSEGDETLTQASNLIATLGSRGAGSLKGFSLLRSPPCASSRPRRAQSSRNSFASSAPLFPSPAPK
jgi:hypothetical protein